MTQAHWVSIDIDLLRKQSAEPKRKAESLEEALYEGNTDGLLEEDACLKSYTEALKKFVYLNEITEEAVSKWSEEINTYA